MDDMTKKHRQEVREIHAEYHEDRAESVNKSIRIATLEREAKESADSISAHVKTLEEKNERIKLLESKIRTKTPDDGLDEQAVLELRYRLQTALTELEEKKQECVELKVALDGHGGLASERLTELETYRKSLLQQVLTTPERVLTAGPLL